jgi:hypothetical protein
MRDLVRSFPGAAPNLDHIIGSRSGASLVVPLAHRADCHARRPRYRDHAAEYTQRVATELAAAAMREFETAFADAPDGPDKAFIFDLTRHALERQS